MITIITKKKIFNIMGLREAKKPGVEILAEIMDRQVRWLAKSGKAYSRKKAAITYIDKVANEAKRLV